MKRQAKKSAQKVDCPVCGLAFEKRGLPGHMRYNHPGQELEKAVPAGKESKAAKAVTRRRKAPAGAPSTNKGAHDCLKAALESLARRQQEIERELDRMEVLLAEKEEILREIQAVETALKVFQK